MVRKKIRVAKWVIGVLAGALIIINLIKRVSQVIFLKNNGWDMSSFSTLSLFLGFVGSVIFVGLAFIERGIHPDSSLKKPDQIATLVFGSLLILYSGFLLFMKFKVVLGW